MTTPPVRWNSSPTSTASTSTAFDMIEWSDAEITMFEAPQTVVAKMAELPQAPVKG